MTGIDSGSTQIVEAEIKEHHANPVAGAAARRAPFGLLSGHSGRVEGRGLPEGPHPDPDLSRSAS